MKVDAKAAIPTTKFKDLATGETFIYEGRFFIKVVTSLGHVEGIDLTSGRGWDFTTHIGVVPVKLKVVNDD